MKEAELMYTTHPIRLATALNYSVFIFDLLKKTQEAIDTAKASFDAALFDL